MTRPLLSAAMIVKNEEKFLDGCLASLAGIVDEIVVVDTGSTDSTVEIAQAHGARMGFRLWDNNFAAARNAALDLATGEWILYIDADERLMPTTRSHVETLLADPEPFAYRLLLRPHPDATAYLEYRLWRNDPRIRFVGVIHEKVAPTIDRLAAAQGRPITDCDLMLDHLGYTGDQTRKHHRNLPLLRAQLEVEPDNVFNRRHLAQILEALGELDEAEAELQRAVQIDRDHGPWVTGGIAWGDLVRLRQERGHDVDDLLAEGIKRHPRNWYLIWLRADRAQVAGRHDDALIDYRTLVEVDRNSPDELKLAYDERMLGLFPQARLGSCLFAVGRYAEAAAAFAEAERLDPTNLEWRVKRQLALLRSEESAQPSG